MVLLKYQHGDEHHQPGDDRIEQARAQLDQMIEQRHLAFFEFVLLSAMTRSWRRASIVRCRSFGPARQGLRRRGDRPARSRRWRARPGGVSRRLRRVGDRRDGVGWRQTGSCCELAWPSGSMVLLDLVLEIDMRSPARSACLHFLELGLAHHLVDAALELAGDGAGLARPRGRPCACTRGKSLGPITTSATTAINASSDHAKSNIAACHQFLGCFGPVPARAAGIGRGRG